MTPQEKAKEIIDGFYKTIESSIFITINTENTIEENVEETIKETERLAKHFALKVVYEVVDAQRQNPTLEASKYWLEVQKEIMKY